MGGWGGGGGGGGGGCRHFSEHHRDPPLRHIFFDAVKCSIDQRRHFLIQVYLNFKKNFASWKGGQKCHWLINVFCCKFWLYQQINLSLTD